MSQQARQRVVIVGASDKPERYSHKALHALLRHGHEMVLVHPALQEIDGHPVVNDLSAVAPPVDTVTLYVGPALSASMEESLTALRPRRVLFNPGAENPQLAAKLAAAGIHTEEACTLVLLSTGTF